MGRDVATLAVVACLVLMLGWIAYVRMANPRHDPWQPEELSRLGWSAPGSRAQRSVTWPLTVRRTHLGPPFPSPTNGVRKL